MYIFYALFLKLRDRYLRKKSCSHDQVSLIKKDRKDPWSTLRSSLPRWRFPLHHVGIGGYFTSWRASLRMVPLGWQFHFGSLHVSGKLPTYPSPEFRFESLKSISVLIIFVYKLMIGSSKNNRENYPRKCFWTPEKETRVKFNPGLSANRPSNNWALNFGDKITLIL